jgi:hypothetical protein
MAGKIIADTLEHSTAGSIATNYVVDGSVKAYGMIDGTGTVNLITSFNASGVTDNGTGDYTLNLTNSMGNSTYMFIISSNNETTGHSARNASKYTGGQAAGSFRFTVGYPSNTSGGGAKFDEDFNPIALLGDLA